MAALAAEANNTELVVDVLIAELRRMVLDAAVPVVLSIPTCRDVAVPGARRK